MHCTFLFLLSYALPSIVTLCLSSSSSLSLSLSLSRLVSLSWHLRNLFCLKTWSSWFFFFFFSPWVCSISWWEGTRWLLWELLWSGDSFETPGHSIWFPRQEMAILPCLALTHPAPHPTPQRWWGQGWGNILSLCPGAEWGGDGFSIFIPNLPHTVPTPH